MKNESLDYLIEFYNIQVKEGKYTEGITVNLFRRITKKDVSNDKIQEKFYRYERKGYVARVERAHFIITDKGKKVVEEILNNQAKLI